MLFALTRPTDEHQPARARSYLIIFNRGWVELSICGAHYLLRNLLRSPGYHVAIMIPRLSVGPIFDIGSNGSLCWQVDEDIGDANGPAANTSRLRARPVAARSPLP